MMGWRLCTIDGLDVLFFGFGNFYKWVIIIQDEVFYIYTQISNPSLQKIAVGNLESGYRSPQSKKSFRNHPRNSFSTSLGVLD